MAQQQISMKASLAKHAINKFFNLKLRIALINKDLWYNNQCLLNNVIPKYVGIKQLHHTKIARITTNQARIKWVKMEIRALHAKKQMINDQLYKMHLEILNSNLEEDLELQKETRKSWLDSKMKEKQKRLESKLHELISVNNKCYETRSKATLDQNLDNKIEHTFYERTTNLTKVTFNDNERRLLDKGLKHNGDASYKNKRNLKQTILDSERALNCIEMEERPHARHLILEKLIKIKNHPIRNNKVEQQTIRTIKNKLKDNDLILLKADKGQTTVVMNKKDYICKTEKFIEENGIVKLNKDPTKNFQSELKKVLNNIELTMNKNEKKKVINMNPKPPILRALPKIHKVNIPIRPIVNYRNAPAYKLAGFLQKLLKRNINLKNNRTVQNSKQFVAEVHKLKVNKDSKMASMDIVCMYTNLPVAEAIEAVKENLKENKFSDDENNEIGNLIEICLKQNYFIFNDNIYIQKEGLGMGNPLSGMLADVLLNKMENKLIKDLENKDPEIKWWRYVDDVWVLYNSKKITSEEILESCNKMNTKLEFTKEDEVDGILNYLDVKVVRKNDSFMTGVYRKNTTTSHTLHSKGNHPEQHKRAAFNAYIHRAINIPNNEEERNKEMRIIKQIAKDNEYSEIWVQKIKDKIISQRNKRNKVEKDKEDKYVVFDYINKQTNNVTQIFKNKYNLKIAYRTNNNMKMLIGKQNTSKVDLYSKSGVYKLRCQGDKCPKFYVGQSGREFRIRFKEHLQGVKHGRPSAFSSHVFEEDHPFKNIEENMEIMTTLSKGQDLDTYEALEIYLSRNNSACLNIQEDYGHNPMFQVLDERD